MNYGPIVLNNIKFYLRSSKTNLAMSTPVIRISKQKPPQLGMRLENTIHYQLSPDELVCQSIRNGEKGN